MFFLLGICCFFMFVPLIQSQIGFVKPRKTAKRKRNTPKCGRKLRRKMALRSRPSKLLPLPCFKKKTKQTTHLSTGSLFPTGFPGCVLWVPSASTGQEIFQVYDALSKARRTWTERKDVVGFLVFFPNRLWFAGVENYWEGKNGVLHEIFANAAHQYLQLNYMI